MKTIKNPVQGARLLKYPFGQIYQLFGENVALYQQAIGTNGHNGIDIVGQQGTQLLATAGEIVEVKNTPNGYGKHIRLFTLPDENGDYLELVYGHCDTIRVAIGDKVPDNFVIGGMGNTGFVISGNTPYWGNAPAGKGVHLHFGVRKCNTKQSSLTTTTILSTGREYYFYNYNNGHFGYLNPAQFIEADTKTFDIAMGLINSLKFKIAELLKGRKIN